MKLTDLLPRLRGDRCEEDTVDERAQSVEQKAGAALDRAALGRFDLEARLRAVDAQIPPPRPHR